MRLELEVLASTAIKRKKPWPRTAFIGQVQESLFLFDEQRLSVLYVPSGKTRRKVPKLTPMLPNVAVLTHTDNGHFICGLLSSGDLFLWHKDSDLIKHITGMPEFKQSVNPTQPVGQAGAQPEAERVPPFLSFSDDGSKLLLILDHSRAFVWELDPGASIFSLPRTRTHLPGAWTSLMAGPEARVPGSDCKEAALAASWFAGDAKLGLGAACSIVFNSAEKLVVTSLGLKWYEAQHISNWAAPVFNVDWTTREYPLKEISPQAEPINSHGAYVVRVSHDGQLTAIAVNQINSHANKLVFMSPPTGMVVVSDLRGCGAREATSSNYRSWWVADMCWTHDDLFLACMLRQGTLCVLTRLGEPALLQTFGCSIEMGPKPFLPLHPLITVRSRQWHESDGPPLSDSMRERQDTMRQRYSVTTHPSLPMFVCSDGYMVTILQIPGSPTCLSLMRGLCAESSLHLRKLQETDTYKTSFFQTARRSKSSTSRSSSKSPSRKPSLKKTRNDGGTKHRTGLVASKKLARKTRFSDEERGFYQFEAVPADVGNVDYDSDEGGGSPQVNVFSEGKIDFGDLDNMNTTMDYNRAGTQGDEELSTGERLNRMQLALMHAWNLAASHVGLWTLEHEIIADNLAHNVVQLFAVLLATNQRVLRQMGPTVSAILDNSRTANGPKKVNKQLVLVLRLFKTMLQTLRLDTLSRHLMVCATKFTNSSVGMLLRNQSLSVNEARSRTLHGCYIILKFAENSLATIYTCVPDTSPVANIKPYGMAGELNDSYQAAVFVYTAAPRHGLDTSPSAKLPSVPGLHGEGDADVSQRRPKEGVEGALQVTESVSGVVSVELTGVKRLGVAWLVLYKAAVESYKLAKFRAKDPVTKPPRAEIKKTWSLVLLLQAKIQGLGLALPPRGKHPLTPAEARLVEGDMANGRQLILNEISSTPDARLSGQKGSRLLLSLLYLSLQQHRFRAALELTEFLIRQSDVSKAVAMSQQDDGTKTSLLSLLQQMPSKQQRAPAPLIRSTAVRHVVHCMARLMAAYYGNKHMFVYPPHAVRKIPPLHVSYTLDSRVIPLARDDVTSAIIDEQLGEAWTSDKALEYLLLCGGLCEAVWLAKCVGDWKTAFLIAVASQQHQGLAPGVYTKRKQVLPPELTPDEILKERLTLLIGASSDGSGALSVEDNGQLDALTNTLNDVLLAGALCELDLVPWLVSTLASRLRELAKGFSTLVPESLYLPAPPLYCPQPTPTNESRIPQDVLSEIRLRHSVASLVQLLLLVLTSSHCTLPASRWYAQNVLEAFTKGCKFNKKSEEEEDIGVLQQSFLNHASRFQGHEKNDSIHAVLEGFREVTSLLWMLHCRDRLSLALRKKSHMADKRLKRNSTINDVTWTQQCRTALTWARHMMPFRHFLPGDSDLDLSSILFSLVIEIEASEESAKLLAEYFHDEESLHPEVAEKMQWLLNEWKRLALTDRPQGVTLSLFYDKMAQRQTKLLRKKRKVFGAYDEFVFIIRDESDASIEVDDTLYIGSRPFESELGYLKFLDEFYAVSFNKLLDQEIENQGTDHKPLLKFYCKVIRNAELNSVVHKAVTSFQRKQAASDAIGTPRSSNNSPLLPRKWRGSRESLSDLRITPRGESPRRSRRGLFRSSSVIDVNGDRPKVTPRSPNVLRRSASHTDLAVDENQRPITPITPAGNASSSSHLLMPHPTSTPRHPTTPRRSKRPGTIEQYTRELASAQSLESIATSIATVDLRDDPLAAPVLEPALLDSYIFSEKYLKLESLLDWLNRWISRNHTFGEFVGAKNSSKKAALARQQSVMRIRVQPRMLLYSVWQLEQRYHSNREASPERPIAEVTEARSVAGMEREADTWDEASSLNEVPVSVEVVEDSVREKHVTELSKEERRRQRRLGKDRPRESSLSSSEIPTKDVPTKPEKFRKPKKKHAKSKQIENVIDDSNSSDQMAVRPNNRHPLTNHHGNYDTSLQMNYDVRKDTPHNDRFDIHPTEYDVIQPSAYDQLNHQPKSNDRNRGSGQKSRTRRGELPDDSPMPHLTDAQRLEARRRKKLSLRHKTLDVILNERYVSEVNTNQNNRNVSGADLSGSMADSSMRSEEELGRHVGRLVAERLQGGPLGASTNELIRSLNTMIDEEIDRSLPLLDQQQGMGSCPSQEQDPERQRLEISQPVFLSHTSDLSAALKQTDPSAKQDESIMDEVDGRGGAAAPSGTLPFGGGGLTDRSNVSNATVIAEELRGVVRNELRRLMEAQHHGILAMLGTFEDEAKPRETVKKSTSFSRHAQVYSPGAKDIMKPQECTVMTAQRVGAAPHPSQFKPSLSHSREDDTETLALSTDTEVDVTPLPSDELKTERSESAADRPLTMSQLTDPLPSAKSPKRQSGHMNGALRELKHLENKHHGSSSGSKHKHGSPARGKENSHPFVPPGHTFTVGSPLGTGTFGTGGMPPMGWMPLLHIPQDRQGGVRFPPIPQTWSDPQVHAAPQNTHAQFPFMPLLRADPSHAQYYRHEIPERDPPLPGGPAPTHHIPTATQSMPLLQAQPPLLHMQEQNQPRLVPPEELLDYEQRKYNKEGYRRRQLQAEIDQKLKQSAAERPQTPLGVKLLRADLEPFADRDERDHEARQRRRNIKLTKPSDRKKKKRSKHKEKDLESSQDVTLKQTSRTIASQEDELSETSQLEDESVLSQTEPPVMQQQQTGTSVQASVDLSQTLDPDAPLNLHHGYAITPGMFDQYVHKDDELGSQGNNFARDQMEAQQMLKHKQEKVRSPRKRNVAVETDSMHDMATTMTKDTATDPVMEAVAKFYRSQAGRDLSAILPPDIYMGLKFPDPQAATQDSGGSGSRAFLNVVDIQGADLLAGIAGSVPERDVHEVVPQAVDMQGRPIKPRPNMAGSPRRAATPTRDVRSPSPGRQSPSPRRPGPDRVTTDLLGQPSAAEKLMAGMHTRTTSRSDIRRRLGAMDSQIDAIENMAANMEQDFRSTKLLMNTIDQIGETILPSAERYPTPRVTQHGHTTPRSPADRRSARTPESGRPSVRESVSSLDERLREARLSLDDTKLGVSGLSDVSAIIGEIVARGELEPEELGFSQKEASYMATRYLDSARAGESGSSQELESIYRKASPRRRPRTERTAAERRELQLWMKQKRAKQMRDYMQERGALKDRESRPFTSKPALQHKTATDKELDEARKTRQTNKSQRERSAAKERERQATQMMRDILGDRVEDKLPTDVPTPRSTRQATSARTPRSAQPTKDSTRKLSQRTSTPNRKSTRAASASPGRGAQRTNLRGASASPDRFTSQYDNHINTQDYSQQRPHTASTVQRPSRIDNRTRTRPLPTRSDFSPMQPRKSLEFSGENQVHIIDAFEHDTAEHDDEETPRQQVPEREAKPYKPKPFTELVRVQRPEAIRKERDRNHAAVPYVDRLSQMSSTFTTPRSHADTQREHQKIRGSKRPAGAAKAAERHAPRSVKTYQERLAEMKGTRTYTQPIMPRVHVPERHVPPAGPKHPPTKPRKSLTYAQQLQALQPPKELYRSGEGAVVRRSVKKAHAPAHAPKTYVEQLQELQPHEGRLSMEYYADGHTPGAGGRGAHRARPYASPYAREGDNDSAVSPWSMDEDVHDLIYNPEDGSLLEPSMSLATDFDITEAADLIKPTPRGYVDLVNPADLEDVISLGGSDITGIIDWDEIDELIADVH